MKCAASASDITNLMANSETFLPSSKRIACQAHQEVVDANTILGPDRAKKLPSSSHMSSSQSYWLSSMSSLLHTAFSIVTCKTCTADLNTVSTASSRNTLNAVSPGVSYRRGNMKDKDIKWARFKMSSLVCLRFSFSEITFILTHMYDINKKFSVLRIYVRNSCKSRLENGHLMPK